MKNSARHESISEVSGSIIIAFRNFENKLMYILIYNLLLFSLIFPGCKTGIESDGVYEIPFIGVCSYTDPSSWKDKAFISSIIADKTGTLPATRDLSARCHIAWKTDTICILVDVTDDTIRTGKNGDRVQLFLVEKQGGKNMLEWIIQVDTVSSPEPVVQTWDHRGSRDVTPVDPAIRCRITRTGKGYQLLAFISLKPLGIKPDITGTAALQIYVDDTDHPSGTRENMLQWYYAGDSYRRSLAHQPLLLGTQRTKTVDYAVKCYLLDSSRVVLKVFSEKGRAGEVIQVSDSQQIISMGRMSDSTGYSYFESSIPLEKTGNPDLPKKVFINNRLAGIVDFGTLDLVNEKREGADFEDEISQFIAADRRHKPADSSILFVGHSFFRYWLTLEDDMKGFTVINRSFGGSRVENLLHYYDILFAPYRPRKIVLIIGGNDLNIGYPPDTVFRDFTVLLEKLHKDLPQTRLIALTNSELYYGVKNLKEFDDRLFEYAAENRWLRVGDIRHEVNINDDAYLQTLMMPDRVHFNYKGYLHFTKKVKEIIESEGTE
jgi:lysophospholipase L1-like esterase